MTRNITKLKKAIAEKEGYMALAHTRLGNRAQRPGIELCRDLVETNLVNEVRELRENVARLQQMLAEVTTNFCLLEEEGYSYIVVFCAGWSISTISAKNSSATGRGHKHKNQYT